MSEFIGISGEGACAALVIALCDRAPILLIYDQNNGLDHPETNEPCSFKTRIILVLKHKLTGKSNLISHSKVATVCIKIDPKAVFNT